MTALEIEGLQYRWPGAASPLIDIDRMSLSQGESLFLHGPSGCGKSTLLSAIAGVIDIPVGTVKVAGMDIGALRWTARDRFRGDHLGVIFQVFNLLPWLSALENVLLPCRYAARRRQHAGPDPIATAQRLLADLGLPDPAIASSPARSLSVGQQQRVAAARALIGKPDLILADEPTSALDEAAKAAFVDLLKQECTAAGTALLFVSHDRSLETHFDRALSFKDLSGAIEPAC
jgi:putative ABC transport system ATP-binding protein